jgi:hypothetical protein
MEKQNRAERRKNKFGGGRANERGGWPTSRPNPVFGADEAADTNDEKAAEPPAPAKPAAAKPATEKSPS